MYHRVVSSCVFAVMLVSLAACDEGTTRPEPKPPPQVAWRSLDDFPVLYDLNAVYALGPDEFVGVGVNGLAVVYAGGAWTELFTGIRGSDLWDIWGTSLDSMYAVGEDGVVAWRVGAGWETMNTPTSDDLSGVWGSAPDDVFAVGDHGVVIHYDGTGWTPVETNDTRPLSSVWGASRDSVFAVGANGAILFYDGVGWGPMQSGTDEALADVNGVADDAVLAVGNNGTVLRFDGDTWQPLDSGAASPLHAVAMTARDEAFAAGADGVLLHWDGIDWTAMESPTSEWFFGIDASDPRDVTAVGSRRIARYDGAAWTLVNDGVASTLNDVWALSDASAFAVGLDGTILRFSGNRWLEMDAPLQTPHLNAIWGASADDIHAAGQAGHVLHYDGAAWSFQLDLGATYNAIDGTGPDDVWIAGEGGRMLRWTSESRWEQVRTVTTRELDGIWCATPDAAVAVGYLGEIIERGGGGWRRVSSPATATLLGVGGYVTPRPSPRINAWAVGVGGTIVQRDPVTGEWTEMESGVTVDLYAVAVGPGDVVYAAGGRGTVIRLVNGAWEPLPTPTTRTLRNLAPTPGGSLFAVGGAFPFYPVALILETK